MTTDSNPITTPSIDQEELHAAEQLLRDRFHHDALQQFDKADFCADLLHHLRTRNVPGLPSAPGRLAAIAQSCQRFDPNEWAWEKTIADHATAGRMYGASNAYCDRFVEVDRSTFNFSSYDHPDPQTIHGLNRMRWLAALARIYWADRDRTYFDALMAHWDFYTEKVPINGPDLQPRLHGMGKNTSMPTPYHELDNFIRLTNWWSAFWLSLFADPMTPERCTVLLARCLRLFDLVAARGVRIHRHNFTAMQMEALYLWSAALPEITGMDVWRTNARNTAEAALVQAVFEDGVQWEKSIGYHAGCIRWYGVPYLMGKLQGEPWADEYGRRLREMGTFLDAVITPDGNTPLLSDSDRNGAWRGALALLRCIFPDITFRHPVAPTYFSLWASGGEEWASADTVAPQAAARVFPSGGVAVLHSSPADARTMVILDNGPTDAGHSHTDNLCIHYEALGRPVLVDPGRAVYRQDDDRAWVTRALSHNTVCIEDPAPESTGRINPSSEFLRMGPGDPRLGPVTHHEQEGVHFVQSEFSGFAHDSTAHVRRLVAFPADPDTAWLAVVDGISAGEEHHWTTSWLLPSDQPVRGKGQGHQAELTGGPCLGFAYAADPALHMRDEPMFWFPSYSQKSPARWLRFSSCCLCATRAFIFCPSEKEANIPQIRIDGDTIHCRIQGDDLQLPCKIPIPQ